MITNASKAGATAGVAILFAILTTRTPVEWLRIFDAVSTVYWCARAASYWRESLREP